MDVENYQKLGLHQRFAGGDRAAVVNGHTNNEIMDVLDTPEDQVYNPCAEARPSDEVPRSTVHRVRDWRSTGAFPETSRDLWISVPPRLDPAGEPPAVLICNDGAGYINREGPVRAAAVLDSLLHAGAIRPTVGVFINPGAPLDVDMAADPRNARAQAQRSFEYDSVTDLYPTFLIDEVLPFVAEQVGQALTSDPEQTTVCGISSGGICAFNAAWHRPEVFGRVISHCGSFVNILGGHNYPYLIRSTERKAIRVFLQSGARDAEIILGSWPLANHTIADAFEYAGYDYRFEFGEGGHNLRHGGALFAETLRWLWREED